MTLKSINGYRTTEESKQFTAAIESRVTNGQAFAQDYAVKSSGPAVKAPAL